MYTALVKGSVCKKWMGGIGWYRIEFGVSVQTSYANEGQTVQTSDLQTSDWYKRRTGTNIGLVQTSDGYILKKKRRTLVEFEKKYHCYKK